MRWLTKLAHAAIDRVKHALPPYARLAFLVDLRSSSPSVRVFTVSPSATV